MVHVLFIMCHYLLLLILFDYLLRNFRKKYEKKTLKMNRRKFIDIKNEICIIYLGAFK